MYDLIVKTKADKQQFNLDQILNIKVIVQVMAFEKTNTTCNYENKNWLLFQDIIKSLYT